MYYEKEKYIDSCKLILVSCARLSTRLVRTPFANVILVEQYLLVPLKLVKFVWEDG
jgi:hypothetical protein